MVTKEHVERVQELESFKKSVEYTVDSETLELIIDNQDSDRVLSFSETYDEKIYLLQKRVQELEDKLAEIRFVNNDYDKINKRYREAIEIAMQNIKGVNNLGVDFALRVLGEALRDETSK